MRGEFLAQSHHISVNGHSFIGRRGELLLDAALNSGVDMPFSCRAGHCGTCCVRVVAGTVHGGEGAEPGVVHACQSRIISDAVIEKYEATSVRSVSGVMVSLRSLSREVMEVGIRTDRAFVYHAGQYAQLKFEGFPARPFSITHPVRPDANPRMIWFHIRRMENGQVSKSLGRSIKPGHKVQLKGPYGSAHFRPHSNSRLVLVGTSTGFAPIWSIATAALRENARRRMLVIAGGRSMDSLYMAPSLALLARFPNVRVVTCCSTPQTQHPFVRPGRPTEYLPRLHPSDVLYVCGAPEMVNAVKAIAARSGATCYADAFVPTIDKEAGDTMLTRAMGWLAAPTSAMQRLAIGSQQKRQLALEPPRKRLAIEAPRQRQPSPPPPPAPAQAYRRAAAGVRVRNHYGV